MRKSSLRRHEVKNVYFFYYFPLKNMWILTTFLMNCLFQWNVLCPVSDTVFLWPRRNLKPSIKFSKFKNFRRKAFISHGYCRLATSQILDPGLFCVGFYLFSSCLGFLWDFQFRHSSRNISAGWLAVKQCSQIKPGFSSSSRKNQSIIPNSPRRHE